MSTFGPTILYTTDTEPDGGGTYEYRIQGEWVTETDGTTVRQVTDAATMIAANTDVVRREAQTLLELGAARVYVQRRPVVDWEDFDWQPTGEEQP